MDRKQKNSKVQNRKDVFIILPFYGEPTFKYILLNGPYAEDVLVEFVEDAVTFDNYMDLKFNLEDLIQKKVDLVIFEEIKPSLKPVILILWSAKYLVGV